MFNYIELENTGTFYIEFKTVHKVVNFSAIDVEDLIRYWYRSWFKKLTNPVITWIYYEAPNINDVVKVEVDLNECISKHYAEKDFIDKSDYVSGDNRNSLKRILTNGVNNTKTKLPKIDCDFVITNTYTTKLDIPNPYVVNKFDVKQNSVSELLNNLYSLINKDKTILDSILKEDNYLSKYSISRKQLDKLEQLELAVNALTKYLKLK